MTLDLKVTLDEVKEAVSAFLKTKEGVVVPPADLTFDYPNNYGDTCPIGMQARVTVDQTRGFSPEGVRSTHG